MLRTIIERCRVHGGRIVSLHSCTAANAVLDEIESADSLGTPVMR
jgi:hypothetical protein